MSLTKALESLGTCFCLDLETAMAPLCFQPRQARLIQFHNDDSELYFDLLDFDNSQWQELGAFLSRSDLEVYGQNLLFDLRVLYANGIRVNGELFDTLVASNLVYNGIPKMSHSLEEIARRELERTIDKSMQATGGASSWMEGELTEERIAYAMGDVRTTWEAAQVLHEKVYANGLWDVYRLECHVIRPVMQMEHHGIYLDPDAISDTIEFYTDETAAAKDCFLETLDNRLEVDGHPRLPREEDGTFNTRIKESGSIRLGTKRYAGFNLNSSQQVLAYFRYLGIEPVDETGKASLDKKVLARFQSDELVRLYLHYKKSEKRKGMALKLVEHCDGDGRIRARFMPLATGTGRFASSTPNLQQVPRDAAFRSAFKAPPGRKLVQADYSAMELRVAAAIAGEQRMIDAFNAGADIHVRSASLMFDVPEAQVTKDQRQQAKAMNFGALFGSGAKGIQQYCATLGLFISFKQAFDLLARWHAAYPTFGEWHKQCDARAMAGESVRTVIGRRRYLKGKDENRLTVQANNQVQGTSADITKAALVEIYRLLPASAFLVATVHDEIIVECDEQDAEDVLEIVITEMQEAAIPMLGRSIKIQAEGGILDSWGDK